ncbi:GNAT family N-acetyltransferase [Actinoplanes sp. NPDC049265]|uniref:GNAT family N-acetyltransferase n=1 Tax=Actinoplanes sp. NPDC049265 TaxID=3363902 RepID=UPI003718E4AC
MSLKDRADFGARLKDRETGGAVIAVIGPRIVGYVIVSWSGADEDQVRRLAPDVPLMFCLRVDERYRCRGIGTRLVQRAEALLAERGFDRVLIGVDHANERARRLYQALGYRTVDGLGRLGAEGESYEVMARATARA